MKIAPPNFRVASDRLIHFIRHWSKEIVVALALAIVAAVIIERHENRLKQEAIENDLKAVATLEAFDGKSKLIGQGTGFFITSSGVLVTNLHVIKGADDIVAHLPSGAFYKLKGVRAFDEKGDIAVLQFDGGHRNRCVNEIRRRGASG
jgi:S1-C subfamily serine protease